MTVIRNSEDEQFLWRKTDQNLDPTLRYDNKLSYFLSKQFTLGLPKLFTQQPNTVKHTQVFKWYEETSHYTKVLEQKYYKISIFEIN